MGKLKKIRGEWKHVEEGTLPKTFQRMLRELRKLDDELGISVYYSKPNKKEIQRQRNLEAREKLLNEIWESWPRKTLLNKEVLQMRGNALKNPEVKAFLNKNHKAIEDCALITVWGGEQHVGKEHDCPANNSPEDIQRHLTKFSFRNNWRARYDYFWGGPKDPVKILFEQSKNSRLKVIGIIQMLQQKEKKAA